ncbi:hypothetical protein PCE1_004221 [Barthelona sp. PCE]
MNYRHCYNFATSNDLLELPVKQIKDEIGGKGFGLCLLTSKLGIPTPSGYVLSMRLCEEYKKNGFKYPEGLKEEMLVELEKLEKQTGQKIAPANADEPILLLSARSGSSISMPGMMDTILNLNLTDESVEILAAQSNRRFALDCYRRLIHMFGSTVYGLEHLEFIHVLDALKKSNGIVNDVDLTEAHLEELIATYKQIILEKVGKPFPQDPYQQIFEATEAVWRSFYGESAITYRVMNKIPHNIGTAVNIQKMAFGNINNDSGTGVAFTRDPADGTKIYYGEYLINAQGEDVVSGARTPNKIAALKEQMPEVYQQLTDTFDKLEAHFKDVCDIEFTIENKKLYLLQTRIGKRTAAAAIKIACDFVREGVITPEDAVLRISPDQIEQLLLPQLCPEAKKNAEIVTSGLNASPGAGVGQAVFTSQRAVELKEQGVKTILIRLETSPEDIKGMGASEAIVTARGGRTSHAAVVARGMGKPCVSGCEGLIINEEEKYFENPEGVRVNEGDVISVDGTDGNVFTTAVKTVPPKMDGDFAQMMEWIKENATEVELRMNAETERDIRKGIELYNPIGIGLLRTEHQFLTQLDVIRAFILAETEEERKLACDDLLDVQIADFTEIFRIMGEDGVKRACNVRLIDPPLHEFLPHTEEEKKHTAEVLGKTYEQVEATCVRMEEVNPMMGFRGCRISCVFPEMAELQARAIITAAITVAKEGLPVKPEIMIPFVMFVSEFERLSKIIRSVADELIAESGIELKYQVGAMFEVVRCALITEKLVKAGCEYFSLGTNDLTQSTMLLSRDDYSKFFGLYQEKEFIEFDPFQDLDIEGVGEIIKIGARGARKVDPNIKIGGCGEQFGRLGACRFAAKIGMRYSSVSPMRIPATLTAIAHASIEKKRGQL